MTATTQTAPPAAPPEARQFDFWLGDWDVAWGDERGRNRVESILDGRVVLESFDGHPSAPLKGLSVSAYSPRLGQWRQTWVDNNGSYWAFTGGLVDGRMVLTTQDEREGRPVHLRLVWYNLSPDALDWNWESSQDGGQTWQVLWQLHYTRRPAAPEPTP